MGQKRKVMILMSFEWINEVVVLS